MSEELEPLEDGVAEELEEFLSQGGVGALRLEEEGDDAPEEEAEEELEEAEPSTQQVRARQLIATRVGELAQALELRVSKEALLGVAEVVRRYAAVLATDLDAFADHAKRKTIAAPDVLLCARRNPALLEALREINGAQTEAAPKRKKKAAPPSAGGGEPAEVGQPDDN